jgi:hypothetical protein
MAKEGTFSGCARILNWHPMSLTLPASQPTLQKQ